MPLNLTRWILPSEVPPRVGSGPWGAGGTGIHKER